MQSKCNYRQGRVAERVTYFRSSTLDVNNNRFPADILMFSILRFGHLLGVNMNLVLLVKNCRNCAEYNLR